MSNESEIDAHLEDIKSDVVYVFEELHERRNQADYDGILGSLPEWVPEPIQRDFERQRNYVLDGFGYKPAKAVEILDKLSELDGKFFLSYSEKYPDGRGIDFNYFSTIFGFLHKVRWALESPPEDAISLLSGEYAVTGYRSAQNLGKGRPRTTLQILVSKNITKLRKFCREDPSADDVLNALETHLDDDPESPIFEGIDRELDKIFYRDNKGKQKHVTLDRFKNIVSEEINRNK